MKETKIDWNIILSLTELAQCLDNALITEISLSCKYLRKKLKSNIFKRIYVNNLAEGADYDFGDQDICSKKYQLIDSKYNSIKTFVTSLNFNVLSNHNYDQALSEYFINLTNLTMESCTISSIVLINIFNNTQNLSNLSLKNNLILFRNSSKTFEKLSLPKSLKALEMISNNAISTPYWEDPMASHAAFSSSTPDTILIPLKYTTKFTNLLYLNIWDTENELENILAEFIINNKQLKYINIYLECLTLQICEILTKSEKLLEVKIVSASRFCPATIGQNKLKLPSVKKLTIDRVINKRQTILSYLISPFVNINQLKICYLDKLPKQLCLQIEKFKHLEKLTFYNIQGSLLLNEPLFSSRSLKVLDFIGLCKMSFKLNITCECPKIKTVRIDTSNFSDSSSAELLEDLDESFDDWTILKFADSINCYKK